MHFIVDHKLKGLDYMEALRKVVKGTDLPHMLESPESFKRKKLEIIIIPLEDDPFERKELKQSGALSEYAKPELIHSERLAWEKPMREKHENS